MLALKGVHAHYGHVHVLKGVTLDVPGGAMVALLGPNGAGKSTTLRVISRLLPASGGDVLFEGRSLRRLRAHVVVRQGISMVPEGRELFLEMTVAENLELGAYLRREASTVETDRQRVLELFPRLRDRLRQRAGTLSGGEQQMLAIARTLMSRPRLMLLDEPSLGLAPAVVEEIFETIQRVNREGTTILLVEQNVELALEIADYAYVIETGRIAVSGRAREVASDPRVAESYLGRDR